MRVVRYHDPVTGAVDWGLIAGEEIFALNASPFEGKRLEPGKSVGQLGKVRLAPPVMPTKVICVGLNYAAHAAEHDFGRGVGDEPIIFLKAPSAIVGPDDQIVLAYPEHRTDFEAELAVVIGRRTRDVGPAEARASILGYTCANDVCDRDIQARDGQWMRSKSYDTYCPLGPWIETDIDPAEVTIRARLNGEVRQDATTASMVFGVPHLVSFASQVMTLEPGDVILTGTPEGIGEMRPGDVVEIEIDGIGILRNQVAGAD